MMLPVVTNREILPKLLHTSTLLFLEILTMCPFFHSNDTSSSHICIKNIYNIFIDIFTSTFKISHWLLDYIEYIFLLFLRRKVRQECTDEADKDADGRRQTRQSGVAEHAILLYNVVPVARCTQRFQLLKQQLTNCLNTLSHCPHSLSPKSITVSKQGNSRSEWISTVTST